MTLDWSLYPNFSETEMRCKCGCGRADMDPGFMAWLQRLRGQYRQPMIVNSALRCSDHNTQVSSTGRTGPHTTGKAIDIGVSRSDAHRLLSLACSTGVSGIGVKQTGSGRFLHLDMLQPDEGPRPNLWGYK